MITKITSRSFWDAESKRNKRTFKIQEQRVRKEIENQLSRMLKSVQNGSLNRKDVKATTTVNGMFFPSNYEKCLKKRGFVVVSSTPYDFETNTQEFIVVLKDFELDYPLNE